MDSTFLRLIGVALISVVSALVFKNNGSAIGFAPAIAVSFLIFSFCVKAAEPIIEELAGIVLSFGAYELFLPIIKALGIAFISKLASSVCSDLGESRIGEGIELAGKFEILLLCLPIVKNILGYALELISLE